MSPVQQLPHPDRKKGFSLQLTFPVEQLRDNLPLPIGNLPNAFRVTVT